MIFSVGKGVQKAHPHTLWGRDKEVCFSRVVWYSLHKSEICTPRQFRFQKAMLQKLDTYTWGYMYQCACCRIFRWLKSGVGLNAHHNGNCQILGYLCIMKYTATVGKSVQDALFSGKSKLQDNMQSLIPFLLKHIYIYLSAYKGMCQVIHTKFLTVVSPWSRLGK